MTKAQNSDEDFLTELLEQPAPDSSKSKQLSKSADKSKLPPFREWTRGNMLSLASLLVTILGVIAAIIVIPEIRTWLRLDTSSAGQTAVITPEDKSGLQLVDISLNDRRAPLSREPGIETAFPQIEIKLRNTGLHVAFIKRAEFSVQHIWKVESAGITCSLGAVPLSAEYDILLPKVTTPYTIYKDTSQSVKPNEVDRFAFTLQAPTESPELLQASPGKTPNKLVGPSPLIISTFATVQKI